MSKKIIDISKGWSVKAEGEVAEILLYDQIGKDFFGEGIGAKDVAEKLNSLKGVKNINVRINSPGGYVFEAIAIYNSLLRHPASINIQIEGVALSAASMIAMAGDTVSIASNGLMMIHDPWSMVMGTADEMRQEAATLDLVKFSIMDAYARKMNVGKNTISQLMEEETWFSAQEAVHIGLADEITEEVKVAAKFDLEKFKYKNLKAEDKTEPVKVVPDEEEKAKIIKFPSASLLEKRMKLLELND